MNTHLNLTTFRLVMFQNFKGTGGMIDMSVREDHGMRSHVDSFHALPNFLGIIARVDENT